MPRHLLDQRLNPVRELESTLVSKLDALGDLPADVPLIPLLNNRPL